MKCIVDILKGIWMAVRICCPFGLGMLMYNREGTVEAAIWTVIMAGVWLWFMPWAARGSLSFMTDMEDGE